MTLVSVHIAFNGYRRLDPQGISMRQLPSSSAELLCIDLSLKPDTAMIRH